MIQQQTIAQKFTFLYLMALGLVALLMLLSQLIIHFYLDTKSEDAKISSLANKQGVLSQKITKTALMIQNTIEQTSQAKNLRKLDLLVQDWKATHNLLSKRKNSIQIQTLFYQLETPYTAINSSVYTLLYNTPKKTEQLHILVKDIVKNEAVFLKFIEKITTQYELETQQKVTLLNQLEIALMLLILITLIALAIFVFKPFKLRLHTYIQEILAQNNTIKSQSLEIIQKAEALKYYDEEIKQNLEAVKVLQDKLKQNEIELQGQILAINRTLCTAELNAVGELIEINTAFLFLLKYEREDLIGKHYQVLLTQDFISSKAYHKILQDIKAGLGITSELKLLTRYQAEVWIRFTATPVILKGKKILKYIVLADDITQEKIINLEYETKIKAIEEFNAIAEFDLTGKFLVANDIFLDMFGYTASEIRIKQHKDLIKNLLTQEEHEHFWQKVCTGKIHGGEFERVNRFGEEIWLYASYNIVKDLDKKPIKVLKIASDITKRKIAEQQINEAQEIANMGSWYWHIKTQDMELSKQALRIHGLTPQQQTLTLKEYHHFVYQDDKQDFENHIGLMRYSNHYKFIYRILTPYQKIKYIEFTSRIEKGNIGTASAFLGTMMDVTERELAKQELEEKNARLTELSMVASKTDSSIMVTDKYITITWVNEAFTRNTGFSFEEAVGKTPQDFLIGEETNPKTIQQIVQGVIQKKPIKVEIVSYTKQRKPHWISLNATPIFDEKGKLSQYIVIQSDISERIKYEKELQKTNDKLAELSLVASKTNNAVIITNAQGFITWVNDGFTRMTGYTLDEALHQKPGELLQGTATNAKDKEKFKEGLESMKPFYIEILNYTKTTKPYWIAASITPILDEDNQIKQYIAIESDITIQKEFELALRIKNDEITASINYAKRIQNAMMPSIEEFHKILPQSFVLYKPLDIVSGDFYWIDTLGDKIILAAVDCTGHGVPGAFMSMIGNDLLNEIILTRRITDADKILQALDKGVKQSLRQVESLNNDGMELAICVIDTTQKTLEFAGAKSPLIYVQNNQLYLIKGDKYSIGGYQFDVDKQFTKHTVAFYEKDTSLKTRFYIFSDGFQDQFGGQNNRKFMIKRLKELILSEHHQPFEQQLRLLDDALKSWQNTYSQTDDILLIGFEFDTNNILIEDFE